MTHAMGSAGLGGADTTVFNETVSQATREQRADRAENHHFRQIMTQRLGCMKAPWSAGQRWSSSVGRPGREAQLPGQAPPTPLQGLPVVSVSSANPSSGPGTEPVLRIGTESHIPALKKLSLKVETYLGSWLQHSAMLALRKVDKRVLITFLKLNCLS